jgi:hypothetical protein
MTFDELKTHFKSQSNAARAIGIKPSSVCLWRNRGIPYERQCHIELLTGGALKANREHAPKRFDE